jgi:hypothetical protein
MGRFASFFFSISVADYLTLNGGMIGKIEGIGSGLMELLSWNFSVWTEENYVNPQKPYVPTYIRIRTGYLSNAMI